MSDIEWVEPYMAAVRLQQLWGLPFLTWTSNRLYVMSLKAVESKCGQCAAMSAFLRLSRGRSDCFQTVCQLGTVSNWNSIGMGSWLMGVS